MNIETITEILNSTSALSDALTNFVPKAIGTASIIAAMLPPPESGGFLGKVHKLVNKIAFNFHHAENKS